MTTTATPPQPDLRNPSNVDACLDDRIATPDRPSGHVRQVSARPDRLREALLTASIDTDPTARLLTAARHARRCLTGRRAVTTPSRRRTLLDMAPFRLAAVDPGRAVIIGGVGQPWRLTRHVPPPPPELVEVRGLTTRGWDMVAMEIRVAPDAGGATVSTETRVQATDPAARRAFARYWRISRLPSAPLRQIMLATVAADAQRTT